MDGSASVQGAVFSNISNDAPFRNVLGSTNYCIMIETRPDEVITVDGPVFTDVHATAGSPITYVAEGSSSGTPVDGFNAILKNYQVTGLTLGVPLIDMNTASGKVQLDGCIFTSNTMNTQFPVLKFSLVSECQILNSQFANNTGTESRDLYFNSYQGGKVTFVNSTFTGPGLDGVTIGAPYSKQGVVILSSKNVEFDGCTFTGYGNGRRGGIMYIARSQARISNSSFINGVAVSGGAIAILYRSNVTVESSTFTGNEATGSGGALYVISSSSLYLSTSTFTFNKAPRGGVFELLSRSNLFGTGSIMTHNSATVEASVGYILDATGSSFGAQMTDNAVIPSASR